MQSEFQSSLSCRPLYSYQRYHSHSPTGIALIRKGDGTTTNDRNKDCEETAGSGKDMGPGFGPPVVKPAAASSQQAAPSRLRLYRTPIAVRALVDPPVCHPQPLRRTLRSRAPEGRKSRCASGCMKKVRRSSTDMKDSKDVHSADT